VASKARIDLEAKDKASQVFEKVQRSMGDLDKRASALSSGFAGISKAFGVAGLAGTGLATALAASVKSTADFNDAMGKAAQRAGVTTEEFSKLAYAASLSDVSVEELQKGLQLLGQDASNGGKKLAEFGVELQNVDGSLKTNDQLLREVADRISRMATPAEKSAAAVRLLGEEGAKLVPLLNSGAQGLNDMATEAERFGQVVTAESAAAAAQFNDNLTKLQASVGGLVREFTGPLVSALAQVTAEFLNGVVAGESFFGALERGIRGGRVGERSSLQQAAQDIERLTVAKQEAERAFAANPTDLQLEFNAGAASADLAAALKNYERLAAALNKPRPEVFTPQTPTQPTSPGGGRSGGKPSAPKISEAEKYIQSLQRQLEAVDDLTVKEQLLRDIGMGRLGVMTEAQQRDLLGLAEAIDLRRQLIDQEAERLKAERETREEAERRNQAEQDYIQALLDSTPTGQLKLQREEMQRITAAFEAGKLSAEQYLEVVSTKLGLGVQESLKQTEDVADKLGLSLTSAFEDAILKGNSLRDVLDGIVQDVARVAFRKSVTEPLGNALNSVLGSIFSFDGGGYTGSGPRTGGLDGKGGYIAMLHPQETVIDHTKGQSTGRNVVYSPVFNFNGPADQALVLTAAQMGAAMGRQAIYDDMARGRTA
jgi:tetratricopeptide (TPR) repeat protein